MLPSNTWFAQKRDGNWNLWCVTSTGTGKKLTGNVQLITKETWLKNHNQVFTLFISLFNTLVRSLAGNCGRLRAHEKSSWHFDFLSFNTPERLSIVKLLSFWICVQSSESGCCELWVIRGLFIQLVNVCGKYLIRVKIELHSLFLKQEGRCSDLANVPRLTAVLSNSTCL